MNNAPGFYGYCLISWDDWCIIFDVSLLLSAIRQFFSWRGILACSIASKPSLSLKKISNYF